MAVCLLRLPHSLDYSHLTPEYLPAVNGNGMLTTNSSTSNFQDLGGPTNDFLSLKPKGLMHCDSNLNLEAMNSNSNTLTIPMPRKF